MAFLFFNILCLRPLLLDFLKLGAALFLGCLEQTFRLLRLFYQLLFLFQKRLRRFVRAAHQQTQKTSQNNYSHIFSPNVQFSHLKLATRMDALVPRGQAAL